MSFEDGGLIVVQDKIKTKKAEQADDVALLTFIRLSEEERQKVLAGIKRKDRSFFQGDRK